MKNMARILAILALIVSGSAVENLPQGDQIRNMLQSGRQAEIGRLISEVSAMKDAGKPEFSFLLSVCATAMSYKRPATIEDYELSKSASVGLVDFGPAAIFQQGVLLNHLAQDSQLFDAMEPGSYRKHRAETSELFARIYESAKNIRAAAPGELQPPPLNTPIPGELWGKMRDLGVGLDERGKPIWTKESDSIREEYENMVRANVDKIRRWKAREYANLILDKENNILIKRYFTERYSRLPYDYEECGRFLDRMPITEAEKKEIVCAIFRNTQVKPPPSVEVDCGAVQGEDGKF
jgi:hypothetical protein